MWARFPFSYPTLFLGGWEQNPKGKASRNRCENIKSEDVPIFVGSCVSPQERRNWLFPTSISGTDGSRERPRREKVEKW